MKIYKILLPLFLFPLFALSQITQIGTDIDGEAAGDWLGDAVSINADGSIMAVGARHNAGINGASSGHVRVYQNTGGVWTQIGADIDGEAADDRSGTSISLSGDGSILAIGAPLNDGNGSASGHVRIFQNNGGTWTQIGADIDGEATNDNLGSSVSLSADGSIVAIGAPLNDGNGADSGHVRVYENSGGTWTQVGADIDGEAEDDRSGSSVSLSSDGSIVAIGASRNDGNGSDSGHVRIYENMGGTWTQIGDDINGEAAEDRSGDSVSLSSDGSILAIGASRNDGNGSDSGHVRIYENIGGTWTQVGADIDGEAADNWSGISVSLNIDGGIVAIGARFNSGNGTASGHVRIYENIGGIWTQAGADIDGEAANDESGNSVSLSNNSGTVAIGAWKNDGNGVDSGQVRIFDISNVLGINGSSALNFSVYPSPTSGILNIKSNGSIIQLNVFNQMGQMVMSTKNLNSIDLSGLSAGLYFIKLIDENGKTDTQKVVKM